jgi:hypothetical protein
MKFSDEELTTYLRWQGLPKDFVAAERIEQLVAINEQLVKERDSIREAAIREAAAECQTVLETAKLYGIPPMAMGAATCREAILALIGEKK